MKQEQQREIVTLSFKMMFKLLSLVFLFNIVCAKCNIVEQVPFKLSHTQSLLFNIQEGLCTMVQRGRKYKTRFSRLPKEQKEQIVADKKAAAALEGQNKRTDHKHKLSESQHAGNPPPQKKQEVEVDACVVKKRCGKRYHDSPDEVVEARKERAAKLARARKDQWKKRQSEEEKAIARETNRIAHEEARKAKKVEHKPALSERERQQRHREQQRS